MVPGTGLEPPIFDKAEIDRLGLNGAKSQRSGANERWRARVPLATTGLTGARQWLTMMISSRQTEWTGTE